jgi:hypothetical protein
MGEISKLRWLIWLVEHAMWVVSLYSLYLLLPSTFQTLASSKFTLLPSSYACWANLDFSRRPCLKLYLCSWIRTASGLAVSQCSFCQIHRECNVACCESLFCLVLTSEDRKVCLLLKTVLMLTGSLCAWTSPRCPWHTGYTLCQEAFPPLCSDDYSPMTW